MSETSFSVNGKTVTDGAPGFKTLLTLLREELKLTGAKRGCNQGVCGACTVMIDGEPMRSCLTLVGDCADREITTIEGLATADALAPIQRALIDRGAVQCGFCTSGIAISAHALLRKNSDLDVDSVREALSGNLCRCSGYKKIVDAVLDAAGLTGEAAR
jgi:aerobic-type carbon monoxide dehydrogenase small subunit (CoxS/CutS family)